MSKNAKKSAAFHYFNTAEDEGFLCQVEENGNICRTKIAAKTYNLKCHLARYHKAVHKQVMEEDEPSKPNLPNTGTQQTLSKFFPSEKMTVSMTKQKFQKHLIQLVVENGLPLTLFSLPAFTGLNGEMAEKLGISLDQQNIRSMILCEADCQKSQLVKELQDKFFFLRMDVCTRHRINYFAVNVQYIDSHNKLAI